MAPPALPPRLRLVSRSDAASAASVPPPHGLPLPYLSFSQLDRYLSCGESYRLHYIERLRPRVESAALAFGSALHEALAGLFRAGDDPVDHFIASWQARTEVGLRYSSRDSAESLQAKGERLLALFLKTEVDRFTNVRSVEERFSITVPSLPVPLTGAIDLDADLDGIPSITDWKTSSSSWGVHEAPLSDQLTTYSIIRPTIAQQVFAVFVKTKEPKIEWHATTRTAADTTAFLAKAADAALDIADGKFHRRPGDYCSYCDFLPVCLGDTRRVAETLTVKPPS